MRDIFGVEVKDGDLCLNLKCGRYGGKPFGVWKGKTLRTNGYASRTDKFMIVNDESLKEMRKKLDENLVKCKEQEQERADCRLEKQKQTKRVNPKRLKIGRVYRLLHGLFVFLGKINGEYTWLGINQWRMAKKKECQRYVSNPETLRISDPTYVADYEECVVGTTMVPWRNPNGGRALAMRSVRHWKRPSIVSECGWLDSKFISKIIDSDGCLSEIKFEVTV